jgi:opacity protein-like surface antigen
MKKLLTATLLASACIVPAYAQSTHYYGAVDFGTINYSGSGSYSSPGAVTLSGGYHFLPNVDLEAGLTMINSSSATVPGKGRINIDQHIVSAVAVGHLPLNANLHVIGKLGLGSHNDEINGVPDDLIYGVGLQYLVDRKLSVRLQYESLGRAKAPDSGNKADMTRLALGVALNF